MKNSRRPPPPSQKPRADESAKPSRKFTEKRPSSANDERTRRASPEHGNDRPRAGTSADHGNDRSRAGASPAHGDDRSGSNRPRSHSAASTDDSSSAPPKRRTITSDDAPFTEPRRRTITSDDAPFTEPRRGTITSDDARPRDDKRRTISSDDNRPRRDKPRSSSDDRPRGGKRQSRDNARSGASPRTGRDGRPQGEKPLREDLVTQAALEAWGAIDHEKRLADRALDFTLRHKKNLYSNERRAVAERVYALLRRRRTVDWLLTHALPSFEGTPTTQKDMLRLAGSRVLHGEPAAMVVRQMSLSGPEENALFELPNAARALEKLPENERFAISASLPDWLADVFRAELGVDAARAAEAMNERAPLFGRVNRLKATREELMQKLMDEGVTSRACKLSDLGVELDTRQNAFALKTFREGFFEIQDEGSQLLGMLVDPPPTKVVDACAGAGGKTLQLAGGMKNKGELFALDIDDYRMEELRRRARRAGVHNARTRVIASDDTAGDQIKDLAGKADRVLVDAPCSGTGTFRRKPDARYRLSEEDLAMHVARQKALLERFSIMVKPGGRLIYGTCSILRAENEEVIADFLSKHPEFSVRPVAEELGEQLGKRVSRDGFLRLFPHLHGTDGFFGAILVRAKV